MSKPAPSSPILWEYRRLYVPFAQLEPEALLNDLGSEGWELVTVYEGQAAPLTGDGRHAEGRLFFLKRPRPR